MKEYNINDLYVVIVVYNTSCQDSISYNRAKDSSVKIIVCDNSTSDYGNEEIVKNDGNIYINMGGNNGLSKAYNAAIQVINKDNRYICLFDDDTDMGKKYFDKVLSYINMSNADILLPVVKTSTRILSPCQFKKKRCVEVKNLEELINKPISAINSGMVIKSEIYKDYKYNENIFLDYLDHDFMREMNKDKKNILVMNDNVLKQDFSMESNSLEASYKRLCILNHDLKEYYKEDYIMYLYQILAYKLVMIKKYKSLKELPDNAVVYASTNPAEVGRFLSFFTKAGLIKLKDGVNPVTAGLSDIAENPKNIQIKTEIAPELLVSTYENNEGDAVIINSNFAIDAKLSPVKDSIALEDESSPYANLIAVKPADKDKAKIQALIKALQSDEIRKFISEKYTDGSVIPAK